MVGHTINQGHGCEAIIQIENNKIKMIFFEDFLVLQKR